MDDKIKKAVADGAAFWSGVTAPNAAADEMAAGLEVVLKGFEALRGTMEFEDEPSSFEAALQATKDQPQ